MKAFNAQVVDDPEVKYYSWGASFEPGLLDTFKWPHSVILAKEGPNDGLVSVQSAKWGEYRGTLLDVNHLDLCVSSSPLFAEQDMAPGMSGAHGLWRSAGT